MARIKARPRLAQPDLTPEARAMSSALNEYQLRSNQVSDDEDNHDTDKPHLKTMIITGSEQSSCIEERSAAEELLNAGHSPALTNLICPQCLSKFLDNGIKEFREHVESCSRPVAGDSESTTSSLSPPPESHHGDGEANGGGDSVDLANLTPYVGDELTYYPETKGDAAGSGSIESGDVQSKILLPKLTNSQHFIDSLDEAEDLVYDELYYRVQNAQEALVQWQNEWMDLDRLIQNAEPQGCAGAKTHKNPRIPKETQIGVGYRDELESFVYGFEYQYHQTKVGKQNPLKQRYTNGANGGRELRQRIPTQKAVEADLSTTPDSEDGIGLRRRGRGQKLLEETNDVDSFSGRGQRGRNNSQIDSESRDQTPVSTFPSGKKRGRPAKPKVGGASRLQELQLEEGFEYDSTPESSHGRYTPNYTVNNESTAKRQSYGFHETLETTEHWHDDTDQDEPVSRPATADSTMTGASDDMRNPPVRSSGRGRKRQNTSDFEDALPLHKRIGRKSNNPTANGFSDVDLAQLTKDGKIADKIRNTRKVRQEDDVLPEVRAGLEDSLAALASIPQVTRELQASTMTKNGSTIQKNQNGKERKIITFKTSTGVPRTPANTVLVREAATDPLPGTGAQPDGKDGPKMSRASLNMRRRWAAKKQAEALGLPVPKIGRYPKGGSAPSTPDVVGTPDLINPPKPLGGRKRKRDEEEPNPANVSVSDAVPIAGAISVLAKKRGGRPKKVANVEPLNVDSVVKHMNSDGNRSKASSSGKEDTSHEKATQDIVPKRKGGRPRKKALGVNTGDMGTESPFEDVHSVEPIRQASFEPKDSHAKADATAAVAPPQGAKSTNEEDMDGAANIEETVAPPQLRRTTRVRRQTSAALSASSQANTQRSGRSSQKLTVTPTPVSIPQSLEETLIKQETVAGPALPRKRGRQPKSKKTDTPPEGIVIASNVAEDEEPPPKRRRVARATKIISAGSTPAPVAVPEEQQAAPQDEPAVVQKSGSRKRKVPVPDTHAPEIPSDTQTTSAEPALPRKRARKSPITNNPTTDTPSDTPGSSLEPSVPKRRTERQRKNADASAASGLVGIVHVKTEDVPRLPEPLTTRARSSGQDNGTRVNPIEELTVRRQATDSEPPKRKGNWGGKRVKGVFSSTVAPKPVVASGFDANTGPDVITEQAHSDKFSALVTAPQQPPKKGPWGGPRHKKALLVPEAYSGEIGTGTEGPAVSSNAPSRSKATASIEAMTMNDLTTGTPSNTLHRPRRVITTAVTHGEELSIDSTVSDGPSNFSYRSKRAIPITLSPEEGAEEIDVDDAAPEGKLNGPSRPKRAITMKTANTTGIAGDDAETSPTAIIATEGITSESSKKVEKKMGKWGGRRVKGAKITGVLDDEEVCTKVEPGNEDSDSEATTKEKKRLAAKASKSLKNSQSMKARWANGSMHEIMQRKKAANLAKKEAAAQPVENGEEVDEVIAEPAPAATKRKAADTKAAGRAPKRRRTMNATMDGAADTDTDFDMSDASSSGPMSPIGCKMSDYERYRQLSSPIRPTRGKTTLTTHSRRKRRSAALRASQSFGRFADDGDDMEMRDENDEDIETEIKKQFDSEYEHFRASTPPFRGLATSNILEGKRKRKPVMNLEEAMRIEAGDEDDFFMEG